MQCVKDLLNLDDKDDSFTQSLRKVVSLLNLVLAPFAIAYGCYFLWLGIINDAGAGAGTIVQGILMFGLGIVQLVNFALIVRWGHVSDLQLNALQWATLIPVSGTVFCTPEFGSRMLLFWYSILCVSQQSAHSPAQSIIAFIVSVLSCYNDAFKSQPGQTLLWLPGARVNGPPLEVLGEITGCTTVSFMVVLAVYVQGRAYGDTYQQAKLGEEARAAVAVAAHVVNLLRRYDTDGVSAYLDSEVASGVDPQLLATFKAMKDNLDVYRPHLPNYVFQESDTAEEAKYQMLADAALLKASTSPRGLGASDLPRHSSTADDDMTPIEVISANGSDSEESPRKSPQKSPPKDDSMRESETSAGTDKQRSDSSTATPGASGGPLGALVNPAPPMFTAPFFPGQSGNLVHTSSGASTGSMGVRRDIEGIAGLNANKVTIVRVDCQLLTSGHETVFGVTEDALQTFVDTFYSIAMETKASVHTMVGDAAIITWNATSVVAAHEGRAAKFLLRVQGAAKKCGYLVSGAACSGRSYLYTHTSTTKQQALIVHPSGWQGALDAALMLARRYNTFIVDEAVQRGCKYDCDSRAVDYALFTSNDYDGGVAATHKLALDLQPSEWQGRVTHTPQKTQSGVCDAGAGRFGNSNLGLGGSFSKTTGEMGSGSRSRSPTHGGNSGPHEFHDWSSTLLYELLKEVKQDDNNEWMYQLENNEKKNSGQSAISNALEDMNRGNFAAALSAFSELRDSKVKDNQKIVKAAVVQRMVKYAEKHGSMNGGRTR